MKPFQLASEATGGFSEDDHDHRAPIQQLKSAVCLSATLASSSSGVTANIRGIEFAIGRLAPREILK
ncbi:MAG: hypothetical protein E5W94_04870 [Mesorhizobium sp.]|nr:MAG: hypothetical protein E5W94_04870 [Mesorhizobium sp.]